MTMKSQERAEGNDSAGGDAIDALERLQQEVQDLSANTDVQGNKWPIQKKTQTVIPEQQSKK